MIIRSNPNTPIIIDRRWLDDPSISLAGLGLIVFLESRPELTDLEKQEVQDALQVSWPLEDLRPLLDELFKAGYLIQTERGEQ